MGATLLNFDESLRFRKLWDAAILFPASMSADLAQQLRSDLAIASIHAQMDDYRKRYNAVQELTGVPWWWVAAVHHRESGGRTTRHLHNGDPLSLRTTHVPAGRPLTGEPPFTWEESAVDALRMQHLDQWDDWSIEGALYQFERYNGFGYRTRHVNSPYLWSGTSQYERGKYTADGKYDDDAVDKQIGVAAIVKWLVENGKISIT